MYSESAALYDLIYTPIKDYSAEAGWIAGIAAFGYMASVPVLMSLTDRLDARGVFLVGAALATVANFGFAVFAHDFWTALVWRALAGIGLQPQSSRDQWTVGIGLPVIEALAERVDFEHTPGGGTEVRMQFATPGVRTLETPQERLDESADGASGPGSKTTVTIAPVAPAAA